METVTSLVRSIFQKESLDDCSLEELQAMARQYSYFTPVQFLLAEKLRSTNENLYKEQLQKLSLHFNNPLWLDHLLNSNRAEEFIADAGSDTPETKNIVSEQGREHAPKELTMMTGEQTTPETIVNERETNPLPASSESIKHEILQSIEMNEKPGEQLADANNIDAEIETTASSVEENNESSIAMPALPDLNSEPAGTELTFQPYHTVDYFASQGIKFVPEEKPTDRFGKQLKSFTDWLKTMKRLPQTEIPKVTDIVAEEKVEQMAEHSIDEGEVVTETMAEVWLKQGNKEKAIETYHKLSLLDPDKSAYFASLAEQLKNS
jgi:hypothetical protein